MAADGFLAEPLCYELASRMKPHGTLLVDDTRRERLRRFVTRFVVVAEEARGVAQSSTVAGASVVAESGSPQSVEIRWVTGRVPSVLISGSAGCDFGARHFSRRTLCFFRKSVTSGSPIFSVSCEEAALERAAFFVCRRSTVAAGRLIHPPAQSRSCSVRRPRESDRPRFRLAPRSRLRVFS